MQWQPLETFFPWRDPDVQETTPWLNQLYESGYVTTRVTLGPVHLLREYECIPWYEEYHVLSLSQQYPKTIKERKVNSWRKIHNPQESSIKKKRKTTLLTIY